MVNVPQTSPQKKYKRAFLRGTVLLCEIMVFTEAQCEQKVLSEFQKGFTFVGENH